MATVGVKGLSDADIRLFARLSVFDHLSVASTDLYIRRCNLTCIRQRVPLLVLVQQSLAINGRLSCGGMAVDTLILKTSCMYYCSSRNAFCWP